MLGRHQNQEICGTLIPPLVIFFSFSYHWIQIFQMRKMQCFSLARNFNNMIRSILATRTRTRRHLLQLSKFKFLSSVALVALIFVSRISLHFRFNRQKNISSLDCRTQSFLKFSHTVHAFFIRMLILLLVQDFLKILSIS